MCFYLKLIVLGLLYASFNRDLSGLDQADIVKLEQEIRNRDLSGLDQADIQVRSVAYNEEITTPYF